MIVIKQEEPGKPLQSNRMPENGFVMHNPVFGTSSFKAARVTIYNPV
jgi:hypothetical protein